MAVCICAVVQPFNAQDTTQLIKRIPADTSTSMLNMDATYNRPFLTVKNSPVALGGYLEANTLYETQDGISEGLSFQARRLTLFMSATVLDRIKFLTEIEFEDGGNQIGIEFAAMDVILHPAVNLRGGIVINPIGAFNQNHDGPKWEFVERPDVAVNMLPATWSNAGFGVYGKTHSGGWIFGYEAYLTNGFDDRIIDNVESKTFLPATKDRLGRFEENNSGKAMITGKIAIKNHRIGELGLSYMGGVYNKFESDGLTLDQKRRVDVFAIDLNKTIERTNTYIVGECVFAWIDVPETYTQQYGSKQQGFFIDVVQTVLTTEVLNWKNATLNLAVRLDYVDWNIGKFAETNTEIGDKLWAVTPAISFRPSPLTVFRLNYRYQWHTDILNNPPVRTASWIFGISTYY